MFRVSSAHLQEDTAVYMQHMVLSLSTRVRGGLSVHSVSYLVLTLRFGVVYGSQNKQRFLFYAKLIEWTIY